MENSNLKKIALEVLDLEIQALKNLKNQLITHLIKQLMQ